MEPRAGVSSRARSFTHTKKENPRCHGPTHPHERADPARLCTDGAHRPRRGPTGRTEKPRLCGGFLRAGDGARTRDLKLGRLALYQLSYSRIGRGC
jgi:hypothetical protein